MANTFRLKYLFRISDIKGKIKKSKKKQSLWKQLTYKLSKQPHLKMSRTRYFKIVDIVEVIYRLRPVLILSFL